MERFLTDRSRSKHIANTSVWMTITFGAERLVMLRKQSMASMADGRRWLIAVGRQVPGRQKAGAGRHFSRPFPIPYSATASPRDHHTTASFLDGSEVHPGIGATGRLPRATGMDCVLVGSREVFMPHPAKVMEDARPNRAYGSSGLQQPRQGGQWSTDAPGDGADGPWGDVFAMAQDGFGGTTRSFAEGVPCRLPAMGDDETHDIPRGSGAGAFAAPGVFLETPSRRRNGRFA